MTLDTADALIRTLRASGVFAALAALAACGGDAPPAEPASDAIEAPAQVPTASVSDDPADGPALWKVADDDTTVYLFGTFHALKPGIEWFNGPVKAAYESAEEVALEATDTLDVQRMSELVLKYAVDPDGRTLSSVIGPDLAVQLDERISALGVPLASIEPMEPWMVVMTMAQLQMQAAGFNPMLGVDVTLQKSAAEAGKTLVGIEGAEAQLKLLDSFPEERQIAWLEMSLRDWDDGPEMLNDMLSAWSSGDVDGFADEIVESMKEVPNLNQVLMVDRNEGFAEWVATRLEEPGTVFMAIGAGHLAGPDSVQDFLRADGITPTRL